MFLPLSCRNTYECADINERQAIPEGRKKERYPWYGVCSDNFTRVVCENQIQCVLLACWFFHKLSQSIVVQYIYEISMQIGSSRIWFQGVLLPIPSREVHVTSYDYCRVVYCLCLEINTLCQEETRSYFVIIEYS